MSQHKKKKLMINIYSILLSFSIATGYFFDNVHSLSYWDLLDVVLWFSFVVILSVFFTFALSVIDNYLSKLSFSIRNSQKTVPTNKPIYFIIAFIIILGCYSIIWLTYYPCLLNYDPWQVNQVINNNYSNWHPLLHTLLLGNCYAFGVDLGNPSFGIIIYDWLQMIFMSGIFSLLCIQIFFDTSNKYFFVGSIIFYALFPFNSILSISTTKDVIFSGLVLLSIFLINKNSNSQTTCSMVLLTIVTSLMLLFRNNAIYAYCVFLLIVLIGTFLKKFPKRILFSLVISFFICISLNAALSQYLKADPVDFREMSSIPAVQIGRLDHEDYLDEEDVESIEKFVTDKCYYSPHLADTMKNYMTVTNKDDFLDLLSVAGKLLVKHPRGSIESFLILHEGAWYLNDISHSEVYGKGLDKRQGYLLTDIKEDFGIALDSKLPWLERLLERLYSNNEYQKNPFLTILFSPALYNWILLGCIFIFIYKKQYHELVISFFLVCLILTVLLGPCSIVRYYYPVIVSVPLLLCWVIKPSYNNEKIKRSIHTN